MRTTKILALLSVVVFLSGCAAVPLSVSYEPADRLSAKPKADVLIVVTPEENRPGGGTSSLGRAFLTFLPLVPYGHQKWTPERYWKNSTMSVYEFRKDLGEAIAKDLRAAGIASSVVYVGDESQAARDPAAKSAILNLRLNESFWHRYFTTYGLSIGGVYLWLAGAPVSYGHVRLELEAILKDGDGKQLARQTFEGTAPLTEWAYVMHTFPRRLPEAYGQISPALRKFVLDNLPN